MTPTNLAAKTITQANVDLVHASKALSMGLTELIAAFRARELELVHIARQFPDVPAEEIVAAVAKFT